MQTKNKGEVVQEKSYQHLSLFLKMNEKYWKHEFTDEIFNFALRYS